MTKMKEDWYPKVGDKFTISSNRRTGDRSWTSAIWECVCVNDLHVVFDHPEFGFTLLFKSEHSFSPMKCPVEDKEEKWGPKIGKFFVDGQGCIKENDYLHRDGYTKYGVECETEELAKKLRGMIFRNNLIFQAKCYINAGDGEFHIVYSNIYSKWVASGVEYTDNPEITFNTRVQAERVIKMVGLNKENQNEQ